MTANVRHKREQVFPTRGTPGGWRDIWDDPDDSAQLRAQAEAAECRQLATAATIGRRWQREIAAETPARSPQRSNRRA